MASLYFLWSNRTKYPVKTFQFYKTWGKRLLCFPEMVRRHSRRWSLIRKGAKIHATAEVGKLVIEGKTKNLLIGPFSFIGRVQMALHDEIEIGSRVCINDGVRIFTASHDVSDSAWNRTQGKVVVEDYVWIGTGAMILPGVRLGKGSVVGAGSVVSRSVDPGNIVVGNPARPTSKKRSEKLNYNPCEFLAANRAWLVG